MNREVKIHVSRSSSGEVEIKFEIPVIKGNTIEQAQEDMLGMARALDECLFEADNALEGMKEKRKEADD